MSVDGYVTRPFGCVGKEAGVAVHSLSGQFLVEDPDVARIVRTLERRASVSASELTLLCENESEDPSEDIVDYLVNELRVLVPTTSPFKRICVISWSPTIADVAAAVLPSDVSIRRADAADVDVRQHEEAATDSVYLLAFEYGYDVSMAKRFGERAGGGATISVMFHVHGQVIITPAWSTGSYVPCPACVYDYALGRVMSSSTDTLMTLSDVMDVVLAEVGDVPEIPLARDDIAFALAIALRHIESMSGKDVGRYTRLDPCRAVAIDLERRHWQSVDVPFSPQCDCLTRVHEAVRDDSAD